MSTYGIVFAQVNHVSQIPKDLVRNEIVINKKEQVVYIGKGAGEYDAVCLYHIKTMSQELYNVLIEGPRYIPRYSKKKTKQMKLEEKLLHFFQGFLALFIGLGAAFCLYCFLIQIGVFYHPSWLH